MSSFVLAESYETSGREVPHLGRQDTEVIMALFKFRILHVCYHCQRVLYNLSRTEVIQIFRAESDASECKCPLTAPTSQ